MGRYITLNSTFKPFSFEDYIKPYQIYGEAYKEMENQYTDLSDKATILENLANSTQDQAEYQKYKSWSDDLKAQADQLATQGLSPSLRRSLMTMRNRYKSEINPMETAYQRRAALAEEQRLATLKDPTLFYERVASDMGLKNFINNPNANYGRSYSGALLTQQVAEQAKNLIKQIKSNPKDWKPILGGQYYETFTQKGFTDEDVNKAINGDADANPILVGIVDNVLNSSGVKEWMTPTQLNKARGIASQGLYSGVGSGDYEHLQNRGYETEYERWKHNKEMNPSVPPEEPLPAYYQWIGNELNADMDLLKEYNDDLELLNTPVESLDKTYLDDPSIAANYFYYDDRRPFIKTTEELQDKYRTSDEKSNNIILTNDELKTRIERQKSKAAKSVKSASFNNTQSAQAMRYLGKELNNIWNNPNITDKTKNRLIYDRSTGDKIDTETLNKIIGDSDATIQFNPYSGDFIINSTKAGSSYVVDKTVLSNIKVPILNYDGTTSTVSMKEVFDDIHNIYQDQSIDIDNPAVTTMINNRLRLAFGAFNDVINSGEMETTSTSSKANTSLNTRNK